MADMPAGSAAPAAGSSQAAGSPPAGGTAAGKTGESSNLPESGAKTTPEGDNTPEGGKKTGESAAAAVKRKLKAIIDGKETEVDEEEAIRSVQKVKAAEQRFAEASKMKKQAQQFLTQLKQATTDPRIMAQILKHPQINGDFRKIAEKYLFDLIQEEQLSPEQKELKQVKEQLAQHEEAKRAAKEQELTKQQSELVAKHTKDYQTEIITTLDNSGLPKTEYTIARMARYMHMGLSRGVTLKAADVVDFVWKDYQRDLGAMRSLPIDRLLEMIGPEVADKIREFDLGKVRNGQGAGNPPATPPTSGGNRIKKEALTVDEFRKRAADRAAQ
jgi:hypothetical protein